MNELKEIKTVADALLEGGMVAIQGVAIVFLVLILLMIVLVLMKVFFYKDPGKVKKAEPKIETSNETVIGVDDCNFDEEELVAVLTAAVAANLNTSTYNLKIKSYRRVQNNSSVWRKAGLEETINHY